MFYPLINVSSEENENCKKIKFKILICDNLCIEERNTSKEMK